VLRLLREATVKYGAPFFILFWGLLCFGGLTLVIHICVEIFSAHKSLSSSLTAGVILEKLIGGLAWGATMWFVNGWLSGAQRKNKKRNGQGTS
jgi:hypothetical protein